MTTLVPILLFLVTVIRGHIFFGLPDHPNFMETMFGLNNHRRHGYDNVMNNGMDNTDIANRFQRQDKNTYNYPNVNDGNENSYDETNRSNSNNNNKSGKQRLPREDFQVNDVNKKNKPNDSLKDDTELLTINNKLSTKPNVALNLSVINNRAQNSSSLTSNDPNQAKLNESNGSSFHRDTNSIIFPDQIKNNTQTNMFPNRFSDDPQILYAVSIVPTTASTVGLSAPPSISTLANQPSLQNIPNVAVGTNQNYQNRPSIPIQTNENYQNVPNSNQPTYITLQNPQQASNVILTPNVESNVYTLVTVPGNLNGNNQYGGNIIPNYQQMPVTNTQFYLIPMQSFVSNNVRPNTNYNTVPITYSIISLLPNNNGNAPVSNTQSAYTEQQNPQASYFPTLTNPASPQTAFVAALNNQANPQTALVTATNNQANPQAAYVTTTNAQANPQTAFVTATNNQANPQTAYVTTTNAQANPQTAFVTATNNQANPQTAYVTTTNAQPNPQTAYVTTMNNQANPQTAYVTTTSAQANPQTAFVTATNNQANPQTAYVTTTSAQANPQTAFVTATNNQANPQTAYVTTTNAQANPQTAYVTAMNNQEIPQSTYTTTNNEVNTQTAFVPATNNQDNVATLTAVPANGVTLGAPDTNNELTLISYKDRVADKKEKSKKKS